jgi:hypothetical protein
MNLQIYKQVATAYNTLNYKIFESLIIDDFTYESQQVFDVMNGKQNFIEYIQGKFERIKQTNTFVFAEIGYLSPETMCIIISQGTKDNKGALLMLEINDDEKIIRMDMCTISPNWRDAKRTGEFPGL